MKILVQFPTLNRKKKFLECLKLYEDLSGDTNEIFFNINCDADDATMNNQQTKTDIDNTIKKNSYRINFLKNSNKISAINDMINVDFDVVICASDDMIPLVQGWDKKISDSMEKFFPDLDGALHFNDGYQAEKLITLSILGKKLYDHFGYIYHPDYKSLYCDNEFTEVVYSMNKVKYIDEIIIKHEHYSIENTINTGDCDYTAHKTLHFAYSDLNTYNKRKHLNFPSERINR